MSDKDKILTLLTRYNLSLKNATLWAMVGIGYLFTFRTAATFFPFIYKNLWIFRILTVTAALAGLLIALFYFVFYKLYRIPEGAVVAKSKNPLKVATVLVLSGVIAVVLLFIKTVFLGFRIYNFPFPDTWIFLQVLVPLISGIFSLVFYLFFYKETVGKVSTRLAKAIFFAIIGSTLGIILRLVYAIHYVFSETLMSMSELMAKFSVPTIPIMIILFITSLYFLYRFNIEEKGKS